MEATESTRLSHRKESVIPVLTNECTTPDSRASNGSPSGTDLKDFKIYPFALVLRLRVLQIVCGISAMVMGTVAFIEEKGELNLGLGIPAGAATVLAAAASIHTSRGFGGYHPSRCIPNSPWATLRFLGPSFRVAGLLAVLWGIACSLHAVLFVQAFRTLITYSSQSSAVPTSSNIAVLAVVHLVLSALTVAVVLVILHVDCHHDPD